ncbi:MAG TPA: hypothetical protein VGD40_00890 [Chryseosolibacter sp.]
MRNLVILSDIHGFSFADPTNTKFLKGFDSIDQLNSIDLAEISASDPNVRHNDMVTGGIDVAASKLRSLYPNGIEFALGLSVGGVILWRAALTGLSIGRLVCFSSTRLRFETQVPDCPTRLYFGANDKFRPDTSWVNAAGVEHQLIEGEGHEFYRTTRAAEILGHELMRMSDRR